MWRNWQTRYVIFRWLPPINLKLKSAVEKCYFVRIPENGITGSNPVRTSVGRVVEDTNYYSHFSQVAF